MNVRPGSQKAVSLQDLSVAALAARVPLVSHEGFGPLPPEAADKVLKAALDLYLDGDIRRAKLWSEHGGGSCPVSALDVFKAFRRSPWTRLDLLDPLLTEAAVGQDVVSELLASHLTAMSQRCYFEEVSLRASHFGSPRASKLLETALRSSAAAGILASLTIQGDQRLTFPLVSVLEGTASLRVLKLGGLAQIDDMALSKIARMSGAQLEHVDVSMTSVTGPGIAQAFGGDSPVRDSILYLNIAHNRVDAEALLALVGLPNLSHLGLSHCDALQAADQGGGVMSYTFEADRETILQEVLSAESLPGLRELDISGTQLNAVRCLGRSSGLDELTLAASDLSATARGIQGGRLPTLTRLDLSKSRGLTAWCPDLFQGLADTVGGSLEELRLAGCSVPRWHDFADGSNQWSAAEWQANPLSVAFDGFRALRKLDLSEMDAIPPKALVAILMGCGARVKYLVLNHLVEPVSESFASARRAFGRPIRYPRLCYLELNHVKLALDNDGVNQMYFLLCDSIMEELNLRNASNVTDAVVQKLSSEVGYTLQSLDLSGTAVVLDTSEPGCLRFPKLRLLNVRNCPRVSLKSLKSFIHDCCPEMQQVDSDFDVEELEFGAKFQQLLAVRKTMSKARETRQQLPEWRQFSRLGR